MPEPLTFPCRFSQGVGGCKSPHLFYVGTARGHLRKIGKSRDGVAPIELKTGVVNATHIMYEKMSWNAHILLHLDK